MDFSNLHHEAVLYTIDLLNQGARNVLDAVHQKFSSGECQMSEGQWDWYNANALPIVLEHVRNDVAVKGFVSEFSLLEGTALEAALDEEVSLENLSIVIEKFKEECLKTACRQKYPDLLDFFLGKDKSLANYKFFDGSYILHYAAEHGFMDGVKTLLYYGAVADCEDANGQNVLHYAAMNCDEGMWSALSVDPVFVKLAARRSALGQYPSDLRKVAQEA